MRKKIIAGNWKMNTVKLEAFSLLETILNRYEEFQLSDQKLVVFAPPATFLHMAQVKCDNYPFVFTAAQNCSEHEHGAFTGEISASMVASLGASFVIIGHSERREYFAESDTQLLQKIKLALQHGLAPIFCCGESLQEREAGDHKTFISSQLEQCIFHLDAQEITQIVIAYEPVWAIGTGKTATPEQAQEVHAFIREELAKKYNTEIAFAISILYGGSVNDKNAEALAACTDIDGALVGGASLKADAFIAIIKSFD
jgi:triosephosphate isomerase